MPVQVEVAPRPSVVATGAARRFAAGVALVVAVVLAPAVVLAAVAVLAAAHAAHPVDVRASGHDDATGAWAMVVAQDVVAAVVAVAVAAGFVLAVVARTVASLAMGENVDDHADDVAKGEHVSRKGGYHVALVA